MISFKALEKLVIDNSPLLLTAIGAVGTIGTAVLTHRAALTAEDIKSARAMSKTPYPTTRKDRFKLVYTAYIPPVVMGSITIGAIVMANRVGSKRAAAVAMAYTMSEQAFGEYKSKVVEKFGESKERNVRDEIAQDRVTRNPPNEDRLIIIGDGDVIMCDLFSMRYFKSSIEEVRKAANDTNFQIIHDGYASLSDFYSRIGLENTDVSDEVGWTQDTPIDLEITTTMTKDGRPCIAYRFQSNPLYRFDYLHP